MKKIVAYVPDLMDRSKVAAAAEGITFVVAPAALPDAAAGADLVVVGEGSLDEQSLRGKGPIGVAAVAARTGARAVAVAGRTSVTEERLRDLGIDAVYPLADLEPDVQRSMRRAAELLETTAERIAVDRLLGERPAGAPDR